VPEAEVAVRVVVVAWWWSWLRPCGREGGRGGRDGGDRGRGGRGGGDRGRGGRGGGDRGGRGGRGGAAARGGQGKDDGDLNTWVPVTKLGRLVKEKLITRLEEIYLHSLPIKEPQIIDWFLAGKLQDEVMKIMPVQKQTKAGQRTRFKAFIAVGDKDGHIGLGVKCSKEVAGAIRGAITDAKVNVVPIRRGYWGNKVGLPHTVPCKLTGKSGSVIVRLIPAPRGTGIVAAPVPKKLLSMAGIKDVYTQRRGHSSTLGNFCKATYFAVSKSFSFLDPSLWKQQKLVKAPQEEHSEFLLATAKKTF
jgi:small subunit ribosomal protein S2e